MDRTVPGLSSGRLAEEVNAATGSTDMPVDDERDLARLAADGDRHAFAALYERHLDAVYRYVYYRTRDQDQAEEVTSEVFHRALVAMPRFEPRRPFLAFLYTIARNVLIDGMRKARPQAAFEDALQRESDGPTPHEYAEARDDVRRLRDALTRLTPVQQDVIVLRFVADRSHKEIAAIVGKPESTVRGIQLRALLALRKLLS